MYCVYMQSPFHIPSSLAHSCCNVVRHVNTIHNARSITKRLGTRQVGGLLNFNNCVMLIRFILLFSKCWPQNATKSTFRQFLVTVLILIPILILILILVTALNILYCLLASRAINNCVVICVYSISPVTSAVVREIYACETHRYLIYTRYSASHIVGRRKLKPDRRRWSFPQSRHGA